MKKTSFQEIIFRLNQFWSDQGCVNLAPYDLRMGAGTFHPQSTLHALDNRNYSVCYPQPCRRPVDGRYGENPNRLQHYYQYQVLLKPAPADVQDLYIQSLEHLGLDLKYHDIRFVEDDWESPTLGAWGLGWEVWLDGMEITQFTYFQQVGGFDIKSVPAEITYGLERLAMYIQNVNNVYDLAYNDHGVKYGDVFLRNEKEFSRFNFEVADADILLKQFDQAETQANQMLDLKDPLPLPAYEFCIEASHLFNVLDARGVISVTERAAYIAKIRHITHKCCKAWIESQE